MGLDGMKCYSGLDLIISEHEYGCMSRPPAQTGVHFTLYMHPEFRFNTDPLSLLKDPKVRPERNQTLNNFEY